MSRVIVSVLVAITLLVLSTAGPCLACSLSNTPAPGSCCHHGGCDKPAKGRAPQSCEAPNLPVAAMDRAWTQILHVASGALSAAAVAPISPVILYSPAPLPAVEAYSPPDLYLLNSVLTV